MVKFTFSIILLMSLTVAGQVTVSGPALACRGTQKDYLVTDPINFVGDWQDMDRILRQTISITGEGTIVGFTDANGDFQAVTSTKELERAIRPPLELATCRTNFNCTTATHLMNKNTITKVRVKWDVPSDNCNNKVTYFLRVITTLPLIPIQYVKDTHIGEVKVCKQGGAVTNIVPISSFDTRCVDQTATYKALLPADQVSVASSFIWKVNGVVAARTATNEMTIRNQYVDGKMTVCVSYLTSCGSRSVEHCRTLTPPPANVAISPTGCFKRGSGIVYFNTKVENVKATMDGVPGARFTYYPNYIMISYTPGTFTSGTLRVTGNNACGSSFSLTHPVQFCDDISGSLAKDLATKPVNYPSLSPLGTATISPNPATSIVTLGMDFVKGDQIKIADSMGRIVREITLMHSTPNYDINVTDLASGVHYITIVGGSHKAEVHRLLVTH